MEKVKLSILGISYNQTKSGAYALILSEDGGRRRVPVIIGGTEAQAIAIHLEGLNPPRPLTHDLFTNFSDAFNIKLEEVLIYKMTDGVFYSEILFDDGKNRIRVDARTSDAVALAIRSEAPIFIAPKIIDTVGLEIEVQEEDFNLVGDNDSDVFEEDVQISDLSNEELAIAFNESVRDENYELAGVLQQEIDRRKTDS